MIVFNTATIVVYGLLSTAILAVWLPQSINQTTRIPVWAILAGLSSLFGLHYGIIEIGGIIYLACLALFCHLVKQPNKWTSTPAGLIVIGCVIGLFLHSTPFFNNPLVFDNFFVSAQSSVYNKHWNFDKAAAGLILLAYFGDICRSASDWKAMLQKTYVISIVTVTAAITLALAFGYIKLDITLLTAYFAWAWANLLITCIAEEMLFRGFVQKHLLNLTNTYKIAIVICIGILFGLAHFAGGITYMILASVAGIGYGYAYYRSGRIESAILTHFLLNTIHFLFFTYPFTKGVV